MATTSSLESVLSELLSYSILCAKQEYSNIDRDHSEILRHDCDSSAVRFGVYRSEPAVV